MRHLLPPLHEGHAPVFLHQAFEDALTAFADWREGEADPGVDFEGAQTAVSAVFGRMRACTDILPVRILDDVEAVLGDAGGTGFAPGRTTYAEAALILRGHCVERLKQRQA